MIESWAFFTILWRFYGQNNKITDRFIDGEIINLAALHAIKLLKPHYVSTNVTTAWTGSRCQFVLAELFSNFVNWMLFLGHKIFAGYSVTHAKSLLLSAVSHTSK